MTIHASKGLEAPIVFLADCNTSPGNKSAYATFVHWPEDSDRPLNFMLQPGKKNTDRITTRLQQNKQLEAQREDLNLLYVALTRAREQLYISGIQNQKNQAGWYPLIQRAFKDFAEKETDTEGRSCLLYQHLSYTNGNNKLNEPVDNKRESIPDIEINPHLRLPLPHTPGAITLLAPSKLDSHYQLDTNEILSGDSDKASEIDARLRGSIIHRAIELLSNLCSGNETEQAPVVQQLAIDFCYPQDSEIISRCFNEAEKIVNNSAFSELFFPDDKTDCYNELPVLYYRQSTKQQTAQAVYGLIDRVIKNETTVTIIDYKSHRLNSRQNAQTVAEIFRKQMDYYQQGLQKIWPHHQFKSGILLTHTAELVWL